MDSEQDSEGEAPVLDNETESQDDLKFDCSKSLTGPPLLNNAISNGTREENEEMPKLRKSKRNKWSNLLKPQRIPRATRVYSVSSFTGNVPKDCKPPPGSKGRDKFFRCNKCPLTSPNATDFMRHYQNHGAGREFTCQYCDYSGDFHNRVRKHEKIHETQKPMAKKEKSPPIWQSDEAIFEEKPAENLEDIELTDERAAKVIRMGAKPGSLVCNYCDFSALGLSEMFFHRCKIHSRAPPIGYYFQVPSSLKKVERRISIEDAVNSVLNKSKSSPSINGRESKSPVSSETESTAEGYSIHGPFKCPHCPFRANVQELIRMHMVGHTRSTGYKCPHCSFRALMSSASMLASHVRIHELNKTNVSPSAPQKRGSSILNRCPHCPHSSSYSIAKHIEQHKILGIYKCKRCSYSTDALGGLNYHRTLHNLHGVSAEFFLEVKEDREVKARIPPPFMLPVSKNLKLESAKGKVRIIQARNKPCPKCPYIGKRTTDIQKHLKHHGKSAIFMCDFCDFASNAIRAVKIHQMIHDQNSLGKVCSVSETKSSPNPTQCTKCPFRTRREVAWRYHKRCHAKGRRFKCPKCTFSSNAPAETNAHKKMHVFTTGIIEIVAGKETGYVCRKCGVKVSRYGQYLAHKSRFHSRKLKLKELFVLKRKSKIALEKKHILNGPPKLEPQIRYTMPSKARTPKKRLCPHCPYRTPHSTDMKRHLQHHDNSHSFLCSKCTFSCNSALSLSHHRKMHERAVIAQSAVDLESKINSESITVDKDGATKQERSRSAEESEATQYYCCGMCPYTTKHAYDLVAHRKMHVGVRYYKCTQCTYSSLRANALRNHLNLHMDKDQILRAETALPASKKAIGKEFKEKKIKDGSGGEVGVLKMENGYRVYTCNFCPYRSSMNSNLMSHYRLHAGSRQFKCTKCTFNTRVQRRLDDHMVVHERSYTESAPLDCPGQLTSGWLPKIRGPYSRSGTEYRCKHCPHTAQSYTSLWYHLQKHKKEGKFKCKKCSFSSGALGCLRRHESVHNDGNAQSSNSLMEQQVIHSVPITKYSFEREDEKQTLAGVNKLKEENETLEADLTEIALSKLEDKDFIEKIVDKEKKDNANPNFRGYLCDACGHLEKKYGLFRIHKMLHKNPGTRPYQCPHCSLGANHPATLRYHLLKQHPDEQALDESAGTRDRRLRCHFCSFVARTSDRLIQHQTTHLPEFWKRKREEERRKRKTRQVNTGIYQKGRWIAGGSTLSVREYMNFYCPKCSFQCEYQKNYTKHLDMHGHRKDSTFMCSVCDYSCKQLNVLRFHELNHHSSMPFTAIFGPEMRKPPIEVPENSDANEKWSSGSGSHAVSLSASVKCTLCEFSTQKSEELSSHWDKHMTGDHQFSGGSVEKFSFLSSLNLFPK